MTAAEAASQTIGDLLLRPEYSDGSNGATVGLGHVARCVALGAAWRHHGGTATLIAAGLPQLWVDRCEAAGITISDVPSDAVAVAPSGPAAWTVFDGYHTSIEAQRVARDAGSKVLVIDDHGSIGAYSTDLVVDQNLGATGQPYVTGSGSGNDPRPVVALGPRYLLLRDEFRAIGGTHAAIEHPRHVLIAAGGQPGGIVRERMDQLAANLRGLGFEVEFLDGAGDVAALMASADLAVAASGSSAYELCAAGTPAVLVSLAANQQPVAARLAAAGAAVDLGPLEAVSTGTLSTAVVELAADVAGRDAMSTIGRTLVDTDGTQRVIAQMRAFDLTMRPAVAGDIEMVWNWSNEAAVRRASFTTEPIPWEDHVGWFQRQLHEADRSFYVAEYRGAPIGQIRFDCATADAVLSFSLAASARGHGWGAPLLIAGVRRVCSDRTLRSVTGLVKSDNPASVRSFELAAFPRMDPDPQDNPEASAAGYGAEVAPQALRFRLPVEERP